MVGERVGGGRRLGGGVFSSTGGDIYLPLTSPHLSQNKVENWFLGLRKKIRIEKIK